MIWQMLALITWLFFLTSPWLNKDARTLAILFSAFVIIFTADKWLRALARGCDTFVAWCDSIKYGENNAPKWMIKYSEFETNLRWRWHTYRAQTYIRRAMWRMAQLPPSDNPQVEVLRHDLIEKMQLADRQLSFTKKPW